MAVDTLGPLNGMPLKQVMEVLGEQGLVVEGAHANGVTEVSVTSIDGSVKHLPVKPVVVWEAEKDPITLYYPTT
ncbi:hypothetical protein HY032_03710 [Candidatus Gottesmanbacteria bacterium]|nr:hypothetical protein [Candidatus Gottesmanbacteria bacterium]